MPFEPQLLDKINDIISKHETKQSALIPVLREVQNNYEWLSADSMEEVAGIQKEKNERLDQTPQKPFRLGMVFRFSSKSIIFAYAIKSQLQRPKI